MNLISTQTETHYCYRCKRKQSYIVTVYFGLTERKCQVCGETTIMFTKHVTEY